MGPRIYNLLPTLVGSAAAWSTHLPRIAAMRFDWVFVNPFHETGGSGSLYAVADYYALAAFVRGDDSRSDAEIVAAFTRAAAKRELSVMMDLVINHTADDSPLTREHPQWYRRDDAGAIVAPSAVDQDDPTNVTVWGDLAELDYGDRPERDELVRYFCDVAVHYAKLGVRGFRCDAAYKVPGTVWSEIIAAVRAVRPDAYFAAETLGCTPGEIRRLDGAGFDALFNSSKYWDFRAPWLLEQYATGREIAPSIAFPESHDTPRVASDFSPTDARAIEHEYRFRYLFAAFFSAGVMMPMGYEFGFRTSFDVVRTQPSDWEKPAFDISTFIAETNAMKAETSALGAEGTQRAVPLASGAIALVRDGGSGGDAVAIVNPGAAPVSIAGFDVARLVGESVRDVTPKHRSRELDLAAKIDLGAREIRVFAATNGKPQRVRTGATPDPRLEARAVVIEDIAPQLDGGTHAIKRVVGDTVEVTATIFRDGHDGVDAALLFRPVGSSFWRETPLEYVENDAFAGSFPLDRIGAYEYTIEAWPDLFGTWYHFTEVKHAAEQPIDLELREGRDLLEGARSRARGALRDELEALARAFDRTSDASERAKLMLAPETLALVRRAPDRAPATRYARVLPAYADRRAGAFAAWYEFFPRSAGSEPGVHGTLADAAARLPAVRRMGFDVVYLPPIHPIGHAFRKGKNNTLDAGPDDPGSPWAIGNEDGGHTAIEPKLGTLDDFAAFVAAAKANNLEVAIDYALQCSPDHPYVKEHPEWFTIRPDGTIKYAENPPKKYQDIVNFEWFGPHAPALWNELRDVVEFWIARGVTTFRVDNPHTKPFAFWKWMIADVQSRRPEIVFLAEAFTRPAVAYELAKGGFTQNYTYFTWRNTKAELTAYLTELTTTAAAEFFRPNFFANTPDILPPYLQTGGRPAFAIRLVLAATLSSVYGIYSGYELAENAGLPGREEYLDSEKYEIRVRDYDVPESLAPEIARINAIRRENPALHDWRNVRFYRADDDNVLFYGKRSGTNVLLIAVSLDPFSVRETTLWFPTGDLGLADGDTFEVEELLSRGAKETRRGSPHGIRLDPRRNPAAIYRLTLPATPAMT